MRSVDAERHPQSQYLRRKKSKHSAMQVERFRRHRVHVFRCILVTQLGVELKDQFQSAAAVEETHEHPLREPTMATALLRLTIASRTIPSLQQRLEVPHSH